MTHSPPTRIWLAALVLATTLACNGPVAIFPGGQLDGPEAIASSWEMAAGFDSLELETRPEDPYSVRIGFVVRDGRLYIDPAEERAWYANLVANPSVRVRFDETIYRATVVEVTDDEELEGFDPTRHVFRLEPRS